MTMAENMEKVRCPYCGHRQNIFVSVDVSCRGVFLRCKARHCGKVFELRINQDK